LKSKRRNCRIVRDGSWTEPLQERKTVNTMGKCILIGAGDLTMGELSVTEEDYVIAVDGGLSYCGLLNVEPDLIIGDFDSMSEQEKLAVEQLQQTVPEKICRLPECKDDTDMLAAIKRGLELGYNDFRIYAATGGRFDHTLANIQCLLYLKNHGAVGYLVDGNGAGTAERSRAFPEGAGGHHVAVCPDEGGKRREYPRHEISFGKCRDHQ
jgi:thiamine pyrophosphokinase